MNAIRVKKKLDSETLHLPELRPLLGKQVEIIVLEDTAQPITNADEFWNPPSLEELARRQGVKGPASFDDLQGTFTEEDFEGFEEALREWRSEWRRTDGPEGD